MLVYLLLVPRVIMFVDGQPTLLMRSVMFVRMAMLVSVLMRVDGPIHVPVLMAMGVDMTMFMLFPFHF
jgi:hypothetical protein